jgi:hypothetical protein
MLDVDGPQEPSGLSWIGGNENDGMLSDAQSEKLCLCNRGKTKGFPNLHEVSFLFN